MRLSCAILLLLSVLVMTVKLFTYTIFMTEEEAVALFLKSEPSLNNHSMYIFPGDGANLLFMVAEDPDSPGFNGVDFFNAYHFLMNVGCWVLLLLLALVCLVLWKRTRHPTRSALAQPGR